MSEPMLCEEVFVYPTTKNRIDAFCDATGICEQDFIGDLVDGYLDDYMNEFFTEDHKAEYKRYLAERRNNG